MARKSKRTKKGNNATMPPEPPVDLGTDELRQHYPVQVSGQGRNRRAKVLNHPLFYYSEKRLITDSQFMAGMWLANDYSASHQHKTIWAMLKTELGLSVMSGPVDYDNPHAAGERFRRALMSLNAISRKFAQEVCIDGHMVVDVRASFMSWNVKNNGMDRFREMLDELYDFYTEDRKAHEKYRESKINIDVGPVIT